MSTELWQRAREVFAATVELPAEERTAALERLCANDPALHAAAAELIQKHLERNRGEKLLAQGEVVEKRFRVRRLVGRGGMGEVYLCDDIELGQPVALKALRTGGESHTAARFRREIQLARRVTHPNVCRVFELGRHESGAGQIDYYTMEYVDGETLAEMLQRRGRLPPEEAQALLEQIAAGLAALHEREIVHRDLKPGNVLLERRPSGRFRVVLTDFGIAGTTGRQAEKDSFATLGGHIMGTPEYMAPEQLSGLAAGPATDLFAFGVVMYEVLTGEPPFPDDSFRTATPIAPRTHNPEIPPGWELLILDCLQADMTKRPQSVDVVLRTLSGQGARRFDPSTAPTIALKPAKAPSRGRRLASLAAAAALALAVLGYSTFDEQPEGLRVALMPLVATSADEDLQVLADGLTDAMTSRLSQYEGRNEELLVIPASEVRKTAVTTADVARGALGVNLAVEGHLAAQDDRIRLTLTLIDAERMVQRETTVINGSRTRSFNLEDEAVTKLATMLDLHALPDQVGSIAPISPGAEEFYLQGKGYIQRSDELSSVENAIQLFERSVALDPNYARAYAGLSQAYLYKHDRTQDPAWIVEAAEAARRAIDLNPTLLEAQTALGYALVAQGQPEAALDHFRTALELNPRSEDAYAGLAKSYAEGAARAAGEDERSQKRKEAEAAYLKAISLRPNDWVAYKRLGLFYFGTGRLEDAIAQYKIVTELAPDNAHAYNNLGAFYGYLGNNEESRRHYERALEIDPLRVGALIGLGRILYRQGRPGEAATQYEKAIAINDKNDTAWSNLADCYLAVGRESDGRRAFHTAIELLMEKARVSGESDVTDALLAHHYASLGDLETSVRYAKEAMNSSNAHAQVNVAIAFNKAGEKDLARQAVERAIAAGEPIEDLLTIDALKDLLPNGVR